LDHDVRLLAITLFLLACDQGSSPVAPAEAAGPPVVAPTSPPPPSVPLTPAYVIVDDADYTAKINRAFDGLVAIFRQGGKDCDLVASGMRTFGARNRTMFDALTRYGKEHPETQKLLEEQLQPRVNEIVDALMPAMTACASHQGLQQAMQDLSEMQYVQRPR
jgi:hypothetical protein